MNAPTPGVARDITELIDAYLGAHKFTAQMPRPVNVLQQTPAEKQALAAHWKAEKAWRKADGRRARRHHRLSAAAACTAAEGQT